MPMATEEVGVPVDGDRAIEGPTNLGLLEGFPMG